MINLIDSVIREGTHLIIKNTERKNIENKLISFSSFQLTRFSYLSKLYHSKLFLRRLCTDFLKGLPIRYV